MQMEIPQIFVRPIVSVRQPVLLVILPSESGLQKEIFKVNS